LLTVIASHPDTRTVTTLWAVDQTYADLLAQIEA